MNMAFLLLSLLTAHATTAQMTNNPLPNKLSIKQLYSQRSLYVDSFGVRDIVRVGSIGFKALRSLKNPYDCKDTPFPMHEIHGWKMMHSEITTTDNEALYVTSHVPPNLFSRTKKITITAHFILPKADAPQKKERKYVKLGFWVALSNSKKELKNEDTFFMASEEIIIPNQSSFGKSNVKRLSVTVEFERKTQDGDLLYLLAKRIPTTDSTQEFKHSQGIALNSLTIGYRL